MEKFRTLHVCDTYTDGVDVRLMASEGLSAHALSDIPKLSRGIASARDKQARIWSQRQRHHIPGVTCKRGRLLPRFNVPKSTADATIRISYSTKRALQTFLQ